MSRHVHEDHAELPRFSVLSFVTVISASFIFACCLVAFFAPSVWLAQIEAGWKAILASFLAAHLLCAFVEYFFHRYVLHAPLVPFLSYFYRQHTRHHSLTRVAARPDESESGVKVVTVNEYPIVEPEQHEASFFPPYTFLVFAGLGTILFVPLQILLPEAPVFLGGFLGIAFSLSLYEGLHALEHQPKEKWAPFLDHPRLGGFFSLFYHFHEGHHAVISANESISGFFGLPIADWCFGTWVRPSARYERGAKLPSQDFEAPRPRLIGWLDRFTERTIRRRRENARA